MDYCAARRRSAAIWASARIHSVHADSISKQKIIMNSQVDPTRQYAALLHVWIVMNAPAREPRASGMHWLSEHAPLLTNHQRSKSDDYSRYARPESTALRSTTPPNPANLMSHWLIPSHINSNVLSPLGDPPRNLTLGKHTGTKVCILVAKPTDQKKPIFHQNGYGKQAC